MAPSPQKVALGTGEARGIGLATATRFLAQGWRGALLDIEAELLQGAVAGLENPDHTLALHCDVSDPRAVTAAIDTVAKRFGRLDALVNNAGVAVFAPLLQTSDEDWNRVLAVNLSGPFICTKAAVPLMREHGGGARFHAARGLRHQQGRARASDKTARGRTGFARHPRQRRRTRSGRHRDGETSAHGGNPRRLSRRDPAQPLRPRGRACRSRVVPEL